MKSDFGIGRITYQTYPQFHCLYKICLTRTKSGLQEYAGPTHVDQRQNCPSLDAHLTFSTATTTGLEFVIMYIFSDYLEIVKDDLAERNVILNYKL